MTSREMLYDIEVMWQKNNKTRVFYVLYSDKTWVFDQSERAQGPIYIINLHNLGVPQDVFQVL